MRHPSFFPAADIADIPQISEALIGRVMKGGKVIRNDVEQQVERTAKR